MTNKKTDVAAVYKANKRLKITIKKLKVQVDHFQKYATHYPTCEKIIGRIEGVENPKCTCGLDE